ncbi:TIGR03620 family F420-dependent LLM class oxidoreductase [Streptomyces sp. SID13031]|uniref:TIGR03620 family F420-dependent LLM class oxidoreductase n=1 Tax=Streptomyces sp. SID13031 TaxID=2706046 RepID=UPI0013C7D14D|nr:TIGR03620 family F420-dependent LLM class oxidoreductase [Streptomyces sp. SID13031]NEA31887.1 TIGR03620 family F420-dependent LLM class oxidoreductase [Streptomyces sp. SID13031]
MDGSAEQALGRVGVWSMELRNAGQPGVDAAAELADRGLTALWIPGLDGRGVFADTDELLLASPETYVVLGVLGIWRQEASVLSARVRELDLRHGPRTIVGLGVSDRNAAAAVGRTYTSPVGAVSEYLDELAQEPSPIARERLLLGALGPRMAQLAAERTAGIHPFLVNPDYTARMRDQLGSNALIAPHQAVVFSTDAEQARAVARDQLGMFIGFDAYRNNLRRIGFTDSDLVPGGSDRVIDALVAWGDEEAIGRRLREHLDAGADHVAVQVLPAAPAGNSLPLADWRRLADLAADLT